MSLLDQEQLKPIICFARFEFSRKPESCLKMWGPRSIVINVASIIWPRKNKEWSSFHLLHSSGAGGGNRLVLGCASGMVRIVYPLTIIYSVMWWSRIGPHRMSLPLCHSEPKPAVLSRHWLARGLQKGGETYINIYKMFIKASFRRVYNSWPINGVSAEKCNFGFRGGWERSSIKEWYLDSICWYSHDLDIIC